MVVEVDNDETKVMVSFRMPRDLVDQLEEAYWRLRRRKTDIVCEALRRYLIEICGIESHEVVDPELAIPQQEGED